VQSAVDSALDDDRPPTHPWTLGQTAAERKKKAAEEKEKAEREKDKYRQILYARVVRDKMVLEAFESLFSVQSVSLEELHHHTRLLNQTDYKDVVRERSIQGKCGSPLCSNPLTSGEYDKGKIKISLQMRKTLNNVREPIAFLFLVASRPFSSLPLSSSPRSNVTHAAPRTRRLAHPVDPRAPCRELSWIVTRGRFWHARVPQKGRKFFCSDGCHRSSMIFRSTLSEYRSLPECTPGTLGTKDADNANAGQGTLTGEGEDRCANQEQGGGGREGKGKGGGKEEFPIIEKPLAPPSTEVRL
jgi:hypothetical protein